MEEPRLIPPPAGEGFVQESKSSLKFIRNAKGDTQIEVKAVEGTTETEMNEIRRIAFNAYKAATESVGYILPTA